MLLKAILIRILPISPPYISYKRSKEHNSNVRDILMTSQTSFFFVIDFDYDVYMSSHL